MAHLEILLKHWVWGEREPLKQGSAGGVPLSLFGLLPVFVGPASRGCFTFINGGGGWWRKPPEEE